MKFAEDGAHKLQAIPSPQTPRGAHNLVAGERMHEAGLIPKGAFILSHRVSRDALAAATDHPYPAAAQLINLVHHIMLNRRRKLVCDVCNGGHAARSGGA